MICTDTVCSWMFYFVKVMLHLLASDHSSSGVALLAQELVEDDSPRAAACSGNQHAPCSLRPRHGHATGAGLGVANGRLTAVVLYDTQNMHEVIQMKYFQQ